MRSRAKILLAVLLAAALAAALCGCGKTAKPAPAADPQTTGTDVQKTNMVNPITEHASLEEINKAVGCNLCKPGVMGVSEQAFLTIDCGDYTIADYRFSVAGTDYSMRAAKVQEDISGVYSGDGTVFSKGEQYMVVTEESMLGRWFDGDMQYIVNASRSGGIDEATFESVTEELHDQVFNTSHGFSPAGIAGEYQDSASQRAVMSVSREGYDTFVMEVHWGGSAFSSAEWRMTADLTGDGRLEYSNCTSYVAEFDKDGAETDTILYEDGSGYFELSGDPAKLLWTGAADKECTLCAFEKTE